MILRKVLVRKDKLKSKIKGNQDLPLDEMDKKSDFLKRLDISTEVNCYNAVPEILPVSMAYFALFLVSVFIFPLNPILTFTISILLAIGLFKELNGNLMLSYFFSLGSKKSVLAKVSGQQSHKKIVFIVPKYIVSLNKAYLSNRGFKFLKLLFLVVLLSSIIFTFAVVSSVVRKSPVMGYWYAVTFFALPFLLYSLFVLRKCFWGPQPVAFKNDFTDNLLTDLLIDLKHKGGLTKTDIYVLFTQDRTGDYSAVLDLVDNYKEEIDGARFVNLDFFNGGSVSINRHEGVLKKYNTSKRLSLAVVGLENSLPFPKVKILRSLRIFTPLTLVLSKGYEGINLISQGKVIGEEYDYKLFFKQLVESLDLHL